MVYKIVHGLVNINANELIHIKTSTSTISTRGHRFKLQTSQFKLDVAKNQFCNRVVCNRNTLPDSIVATDIIVHFKETLRTVHFEAALTFQPTLLIAIVSAWLIVLLLCFQRWMGMASVPSIPPPPIVCMQADFLHVLNFLYIFTVHQAKSTG